VRRSSRLNDAVGVPYHATTAGEELHKLSSRSQDYLHKGKDGPGADQIISRRTFKWTTLIVVETEPSRPVEPSDHSAALYAIALGMS
jgi:hypothetical protein